MVNTAKAKILLSYLLTSFNKIFQGHNAKWVKLFPESVDNFHLYKNYPEFVNAAGLYINEDGLIHYILPEESDPLTIRAILQYHDLQSRVRLYLNRNLTSDYVDAMRARGFYSGEGNTKAWFIISFRSGHNRLNVRPDGTVNNPGIVFSIDDTQLNEFLSGDSIESFSMGFHIAHAAYSTNISYFARLIDALECNVSFIKSDNLL